ncbi:hypothetical protein ABIA33_002990 [Streptacidiphilus sp. MAP12-16]
MMSLMTEIEANADSGYERRPSVVASHKPAGSERVLRESCWSVSRGRPDWLMLRSA